MTGKIDRQVDQGFDGREVSLRVGESLVLSLPENPTTGFTWEIHETGSPACALRDTVFDPPTAGVGRGGTRRWRFEAVQAATSTLALVYRRASEDRPPARRFRLTIRVDQ
jgi:inhibitor of cysteine peptidase